MIGNHHIGSILPHNNRNLEGANPPKQPQIFAGINPQIDLRTLGPIALRAVSVCQLPFLLYLGFYFLAC
jgi:hypothetical protein